ncbi:MAG: TonB family protein [Deltaproteobacteria bacterium]|nr:TonB family protein [Deltaproteobacteria bacterium]
MDPDRWQQIQEIFDRALLVAPMERADFVQEAAHGDAVLLREVQTLLDAEAASETFLEDALEEGLELFQSTSGKLASTEVGHEPKDPSRFGKYEVLELVGEGGFGKVYRGRDPQLERQVAIKTCTSGDPQLRKRFFREARIAAGLQHPKIVTVHDFGEQEGLPFLVQEFLPGEDLDHLIARREPLPLPTQRDFLQQIARGLAYAHQAGVLHRDIKPGNVRVLPNGQIKILDFGIACLIHEDQRLTQEHMTVGTVGYIAPEQLTGDSLEERSDIFSFGVLAYELLCRQRPFRGRAFADIAHQILHVEELPLQELRPEIPQDLAECIHRCLAKDPEERFSNFEEVSEHLLALPAGALSGSSASPLEGDSSISSSTSHRPDPQSPHHPTPNQLTPVGAETSGEAPTRGRVTGLFPAPIWVGGAVLLAVILVAALSQFQRQPAMFQPQVSGDSSPMKTPPGASMVGGATIGAPAFGKAAAEALLAGAPAESTDSAEVPLEVTALQAEILAASPTATPPPHLATSVQNPELNETSSGGVSTSSDAPLRASSDPSESPPEPHRAELRELPSQASQSDLDSNPLPQSQLSSSPALGLGASGDLPASISSRSNGATTEDSSPPMADTLGQKADDEASSAPQPSKPTLLKRPEPKYPALAQRRGQEAQVTVAVLVDEEGKVQQALVTRSSGSDVGFEEAAREAALQASFRAAERDGRPVQEWTELVIDFRLP